MRPLSTNIQFSDEQAMLLDSATAFCRERSPSLTVRALIPGETGFDRGLWDEIVRLGWLGIAVPEDHGGSGLNIGHTALIAEPMGRHLLATPFTSSQLCLQGLLAGGTGLQQAHWLHRLCQGEIGTVALFEDDGDWTLTRPHCRAELQGATVTLHGAKTLVTDAAVADVLLVSVRLDGAPALAVVPATELPTGSLQRETVIDETRRCYRLQLDGLTLPAGALITGAAATAALQAIGDAALLLASAEAAGGIAGALAVIVDYLNTRSTFGRKIGSYQGLKHPSADILVGLERARSHVAHAATLLIDGEDAEVALRMAKVEAGDSAVFAGDRAVQFHGGFGFTYDCDAQLYLRRALWLQAWFGDAAHHRRRLADLLLPARAAAA
jgi:alkylation response protein AidB-like acyl-CoA dehydrogenase